MSCSRSSSRRPSQCESDHPSFVSRDTRSWPRSGGRSLDAHLEGFNTQDDELFLSVFGDTAIIIDGIAPYRWLNPNGPANWLADVTNGVRISG